MSISQYLWTVARELRTVAYPPSQGAARDTLENGIRIISVIANALEANAPADVASPGAPAPARADTDRLPGPAENAAAYGDCAEALAAAAEGIDRSTGDPLDSAQHRAMIAWEASLLGAAVDKMDAAERAAPVTVADEASNDLDPPTLQALLRDRLGDPTLTVTHLRPLTGGRSRQTFLFNIDTSTDLPRAQVLQRALIGGGAGAEYASAANQCELLARLHAAGLKVARPILYDTAQTVLGGSFMITERLSGETVESDYWLLPKGEAIVLDLAEQMGRLHAQPAEAYQDLLGPPHRTSTLAEEVEHFAQQWHAQAHWPSVTMSGALAWLRANVAAVDDRLAVAHNDMVFHNLLAENGRLTAVLDWEHVRIEHPAADLGYCYPQVADTVGWPRFLAAYRAAGGPAVSQREIDFYAVRAPVRLMTLVLRGGRDAFEQGLADNVLVASAGAYFTQRLLHRLSRVMSAIASSR